MPIYEYHCPNCGHEFEELIFHREEADEVECPKCGYKKPQRGVSSFKGSTSSSSNPSGGCGAPSGFS